jgi:hypothetical protein
MVALLPDSDSSVAVTVKVERSGALVGAPLKVTMGFLSVSGVAATAPTANTRTMAIIALFNKLRVSVDFLHCIGSSPIFVLTFLGCSPCCLFFCFGAARFVTVPAAQQQQ